MGSVPSIKDVLGELKKESYIPLLSKLIGEAEFVQNNPPDLIPEEDKIVNHVLDVLNPFSIDNGGSLIIKQVNYADKRGNLIIEYPGTVSGKVISFVGSHMDVVPANRDTWEFDPFSLSIDGDKLRGRGTTDCLGHVTLLTELLKKIAETKLKLKSSVVVIFIASEENNLIPGIGVEQLYADGYFNHLKGGPLYWVDAADSQPCIGTGGSIPWSIKTTGKLFHSGMPNKAINALELAMDALKPIQLNFYEDFPADSRESDYGFETPSTMKPTQWSYPGGGLNQIPGESTIAGDVRLTPFYEVKDVVAKIQAYADDINANVEDLESRGPVSKYTLPEEGIRGRIDVTFGEPISGIACDVHSLGFQILSNATMEVIGYVKPFSITGSLPLVRELQNEGYDVQTIGYGLTDTYHADNEYCNFSDMANGYKVFASIISQLEEVC
ncbi:acetylornithine deacetylase-like [Benincasa hispida]|uniref:acetylornithine deacetylase-like n=1 Tax=Benincasa hispida TaxID=102211 RepID=UPI001900F5AE|nr:acetylornithine deacetylase-like [Benincasa hispida]